MISEPVLVATITASGVVISAWITRAMLKKNHLGWMVIGFFLGAGCMYALAVVQAKELVNVALKKQVKASRSIDNPPCPPAYAIDDDPNTHWNSGALAPQWIEIDLGKPYKVEAIELIASQTPLGPTLHRVVARNEPNANWTDLCSFEGDTSDHQTLRCQPESPWPNVRFISIQTERSPSWIAWFEVKIFAKERWIW